MSGQPSLFGLDLGLENFSLKIPNVPIFFPLGQKKIASDWVKKYPGQSRVGLLFTAGQKYARVGSGPITTMTTSQPQRHVRTIQTFSSIKKTRIYQDYCGRKLELPKN